MPLDRILVLLLPLLGVLVGGLMTYFATRSVETRRWKQQKRDRLAEGRRDAISQALAWLDPMDRTLTTVNMLVSSLLQLHIEDEDFLDRFPSLNSELAKSDVQPGIRPLLPIYAYQDGSNIVRGFGSIRVSQRYFGAFRCFSWVI